MDAEERLREMGFTPFTGASPSDDKAVREYAEMTSRLFAAFLESLSLDDDLYTKIGESNG